MLALARYTLKGPYQATLVVGLLAIIAVFIMPVMGLTPISFVLAMVTNLLAVVLVGLVILTQGSATGLKVIVVATLVLSLAALMGLGSAAHGISMALQWLPIIVLAQILRSTNLLSMTLLAGVVISSLVIGFQFFYWVELESYWFNMLVPQQEGAASLGKEEKDELLLRIRLLMLVLASAYYLMYVLVILIARWLQAKLSESRGFGREFRALALGKPAALVAVAVVPLGLWLQQAWLLSFALVMVVAFMFQGIAVVHSRLAAKKQALGLFVLFYVLLVAALQITGLLTAITGVVDNWLDFRKKPENRNNVN